MSTQLTLLAMEDDMYAGDVKKVRREQRFNLGRSQNGWLRFGPSSSHECEEAKGLLGSRNALLGCASKASVRVLKTFIRFLERRRGQASNLALHP